MIDPYQVLGIPRNASEEDIKKAYRQKAKQYHPDLHPGDAEAARKMNEVNEAYDMLKNPEKYERKRAQEQQQSAYRQQNYYNGYGGYGQNSSGYQRGYGSGSYGYRSQTDYDDYEDSRGGYYTNWGGFNFEDFFGGFGRSSYHAGPTVQAGDPADLANAINLINAGRYQDAINTLSRMTSSYRNARWYYVSAVAYRGAGNDTQALDQIQKAVQMEPGNSLYQQLYREYTRYQQTGEDSYYTRRSSGFSIIRIIGLVILLMFILRLLFGCMSLGFFII